ncbi:MAG: hypothetical protein BWY15_02230 [Firmicutes bacterium ADurb.Bin193]|nr:MAG: hypothetical protein BWY15_02230 [Firmicutes bacterium ADurb.Bin193]
MPKPKQYVVIFNKEINGNKTNWKELYLESLRGKSDKYIYNQKLLLSKAYEFEKNLDKDICEFNKIEFEGLLNDNNFKFDRLGTLTTNMSILRSYINFSNKFVKNNISYLDDFRGAEALRKYVKTDAKDFIISRSELDRLESMLYNPRDAAILELLFLGLSSDEILNIKISDCIFESNSFSVKEKNNTRYIYELSDKTKKIIKLAADEENYYDNNGKGSKSKRNHSSLAHNGKLIRTGNTTKGSLDKTSITNIIQSIKKHLKLKNLTPTDLNKSGFFDLLQRVEYYYKISFADKKNNNIFKRLLEYWHYKTEDNTIHNLKPEYIEFKQKSDFIIENEDEYDLKLIEYIFSSISNEQNDLNNYLNESDFEFIEGNPRLLLHIKNEKGRNYTVIKKAKEQFKNKNNGILFCEACKSILSGKYGQLGCDVIEGHHNIPFAVLPKGSVIKISDIKMLCPNCHRIIHKLICKQKCESYEDYIEELKSILNEHKRKQKRTV